MPPQPSIAAERPTAQRSAADSPLWTVVALVLVAAVFAWSQVSVFPLMDGWWHFPLGSPDRVPYRDFFFPVPPLTYWESLVAEGVGLPLVVTRVCFVVVAVLWAWALIDLARRCLNRSLSALLAVTAMAAALSVRLEPLDGWNLQSNAYLAIGACMYVRSSAGLLAAGSDPASGIRDRRVWLPTAAAGVAFALALLTKQTAVVPIIGVTVAVTTWVRWRYGRTIGRRVALASAAVAAVVVISVGVAAAVLAWQGAAGDALADLGSGGGKNPSIARVGELLIGLASMYGWGFVVVVVGSVVGLALLRCVVSPTRSRVVRIVACAAVLAGSAYAAFVVAEVYASDAVAMFAVSAVVLVAAGLVATVVVSPVTVRLRALAIWLVVFGVLVPVVVVLVAWPNQVLLVGFGAGRMGLLLIDAVIAGTLVTSIGLLSPRARGWLATHVDGRSDSRGEFIRDGAEIGLVMSVALVASSLIQLLSSGGQLFLAWFLPSFVAYAAVMLAILGRSLGGRAVRPLVVGWFVVFSTAAVLITALVPYRWYGWKEPPLTNGPRVEVEFAHLEGLRLAPESADFYERLAAAEGRALTESRAAAPRVFAFPNIPAALSVTTAAPYHELSCPVMWPDLCPDTVIAKDLERFRADPSEVIVWAWVSDRDLTVHEDLYVHHRSAMRDWLEYAREQVASGAWREVDTIPVTDASPNRWPITIFARVG